MNQELITFDAMCEAVGPDATPAQVERLTHWALENIGTAYYGAIEQIAAENDISDLITEFSMRRGEMGQ
jgi:hypothetical protein